MKSIFSRNKSGGIPRWLTLALAAVMVWALVGSGAGKAGASAPDKPAVPALACPGGQCFEDVPGTDPFSAFINHLGMDNIIVGYPCGSPPAGPCVAPNNRPYYLTGANVTRGQMSKFVDLGRRNIADAVGLSLVINGTAYTTLQAKTTSGGYAIRGDCLTPGNNCYAVAGFAPAGDYAAVFGGGRGVFASSSDNGYPGIQGIAYGTNAGAYGGEFSSDNWNALRVDAPPAANGRAQVYVSGTAGNLFAEDIDPGGLYVNGNLTVTGSKTGYVVDIMQNADSSALEPGDVVVIVGNSAAVIGQIPVVTVKKATSANDTGVAGIVDQPLYVPDAATRAAYEQQQQAVRQAETQRNQEAAAAKAAGRKPDFSNIAMPDAPITDVQGLPHATDAASAAPGGYANVVTLGSYKAVKVDASFGPIHAGDLLTTSPHAGYAMKVTDKAQAYGAVIGKALGNVETGTGLVPVLVTLK